MPKVVPEYKEAARRRIIEHAKRLFTERGYYKTRMTDIADSMGVSKGALYQYFASKDALLVAVIESHADQRGQAVQSFLDSGGWMTLSTSEFFDKMLSLRMGSSPLNLDLMLEAGKNRVVMEWLTKSGKKWVAGLTRVLKEYQRKGEIRDDIHPESLARGILAIRDGLYSSLNIGVPVSKVRKAWVLTMELILQSLRPMNS